MRVRALVWLSLLLGAPAFPATTVIDFDRLPPEQNRVASPYTEDGFVMELVPDPRCTFPSLEFAYYSWPSTGNLAITVPTVFDPWTYCAGDLQWSVSVVVRRPYDQSFDARAIDLACWGSGEGTYCGESVFVKGTTADGRIVEQTCHVVTYSFSTCALDSRFRNLIRLEWLEGAARAYSVLYDNIVLESGSAEPTPWIEVIPRPLEFGQVVVNGSKTLKANVNNKGNAPLSVITVGSTDPLGPPFFVTQNSCTGRTLQPGKTCTFSVSFMPSSTGEYLDSLSVVSDDPYTPTVRVNVRGLALTVGGQALGLRNLSVTCENKTKKTKVTFPVGTEENGAWDCQVAGLPVKSGDEITMTVKGLAE